MSLPRDLSLFEVAWEVANKVGGIHTVVSTKARGLQRELDDQYVTIGPWLLSEGSSEHPFEPDPAYEGFAESCREMGVPVRVGRWLIPDRPLTILVEFSGLYSQKDGILSGLWEDYEVDSLFGAWDYVEPILFGHAAAMVIEKWWEQRLSAAGPTVAQFHEWMTASGLLYLKSNAPEIGTIFTTHATVLGRALSSAGVPPVQALANTDPAAAARAQGVRAKHSMERIAAREADVFTTVSQLTAREAELVLGRTPDPVTPNGIDLEVTRALVGPVTVQQSKQALRKLARRFLGEDLDDAGLMCIAGRYEVHNKGIDLLLEAAGDLNRRQGRRMVLFVLVPAANTGLRSALRERMEAAEEDHDGPVGVSTHRLADPDGDPVQVLCRDHGLLNAPGSRVKVVQVPIYLNEHDGFFGMSFEAVLQGMDWSCFPSFYEPWGYTPAESLTVGVPTITTDMAGIGLWMREHGLGPEDGITILPRAESTDIASRAQLVEILEAHLGETATEALAERCRATAQRLSWENLIGHYYQAYERACSGARRRVAESPRKSARPLVLVDLALHEEAGRPRLIPFQVAPRLPEQLAGLERLARNFWWCWNPDAEALFRDLSPPEWERSGRNPFQLLRNLPANAVQARASDPDYASRVAAVLTRFDAYLEEKAEPVPLEDGRRLDRDSPIVYLCAEFAVHESLPIYSGGLGVLAGDHLKSASDLNLPLMAVGIWYSHGYHRQRLTALGEQLEENPRNVPEELPLERVLGPDGSPVRIEIQLPSSVLSVMAWRARVGRVDLLLLDCDLPENRPEDRAFNRSLYAGDLEMRLKQEILLGKGAVRLLEAMGVEPAVYHLNEGHAAFAALERLRTLLRDDGLSFLEARELVRASTVFTTHTPVPAGHDQFDEDLLRRYFSDAPKWLGLSWDAFLDLGRPPGSQASFFNMTHLAAGLSAFRNGVSKLHGEVSRGLLRSLWPQLLQREIPVDSVTNGIHLSTWTRPALAAALGADARAVAPADFAAGPDALSDEELWRLREDARHALLVELRQRLQRSFVERGESPRLLARMLDGLDPKALLVGFARRFAPYKRAGLLFADPARLEELVCDPKRPMRFFFAGKAHPLDGAGKEIARRIFEMSRTEPFIGRVFVLENYEIDLARALVQGTDVWLNTPIRGLEASGTSGMKAAANGVLNLSVLDGWWCEACDGENGWALGGGQIYERTELQDEADAARLYQILDDELLPLFFRRGSDGLPREWLARVRHCLKTIPTRFNTDRMVGEYAERAYLPLARRLSQLAANDQEEARSLAAARHRLAKAFQQVKVQEMRTNELDGLTVGDSVEAQAVVQLGELAPDEVEVELLLGHVRNGEFQDEIHAVRLAPDPSRNGEPVHFHGGQRLEVFGRFACAVRVRGRLPGVSAADLPELVIWA